MASEDANYTGMHKLFISSFYIRISQETFKGFIELWKHYIFKLSLLLSVWVQSSFWKGKKTLKAVCKSSSLMNLDWHFVMPFFVFLQIFTNNWLNSYFPNSPLSQTSLFPQERILSVQFSSVTQSFPTPCDPVNRSSPGLPVH